MKVARQLTMLDEVIYKPLIERKWAMPSRYTFDIKPIKELLADELTDGLWIDPFANESKIATITNDINPSMNTDYHLDAKLFFELFDDNSIDGILYDPPYSPRQVMECYNGFGLEVTQEDTKMSYYSLQKDQIARILKPGGKVISFGWNSNGVGINRGFKMTRILMVAHGGAKNDTICTVEIKV